MSRHDAKTLGIFLITSMLGIRAIAQNIGPMGKADLGNPESVSIATKYETAPGTGVLVLQAFAEKTGVPMKGLVRLQLTNLANNIGLVQAISGDEEGIFANIQPGNYEIAVGAFGYITEYQKVQVLATVHREPIEFVLQRDPSAVSLEITDNVISPKARKEAKHAVSLLKLGDLAGAQKHLEQAEKLAPSSSDVNFLLGYLYFQKKSYTQAEAYLSTAASLSPNSANALALLGRTDLQLEHYPAARSALERAVLADAESWSSHDLLADAYLHEKNYDKARDEAQIAISKGEKFGKSAAGPAEIVLAQAFLGLGRQQEAIQAFNTFLKDSPHNPMVPQVHSLLTGLEKHNPNSVSSENPTAPAIDTSHADPLNAIPAPELSKTQTWRPPDIDDIKPTFTPGVTCDTAHVIAESGTRVQEFVQDLTRIAADENLFHQSMDAFGFPVHTETRKYNYVAMVSESQPGTVSIEEFRADKGTQEGDPDAIQSMGFMTLALVFHPDMQKDFQFDCEGQSDWRGQTSWIVHFRQRQDRPNRMHAYTVGHQDFPVGLKGRAWISVDKFQIVRMEADMVEPVPAIALFSEHQAVDYGPVPFPKKNTTLWLPKNAEIYIALRKHHYYRRHTLDHYLLFSVDTEEKRKVPQIKSEEENSATKDPS
jgi:tetratricopeptide (TPR) repeat protein